MSYKSTVSLNEAELVCNQIPLNNPFQCLKSKIALVTKGDYKIHRKGESLSLQKGDVFVSSAGDYMVQANLKEDVAQAIILDISNSLIQEVMDKLLENDISIYEALRTKNDLVFERVEDPIIAQRIWSLWNKKKAINGFSKLIDELYLQEIIVKLIQNDTLNLLRNTKRDLSCHSKIAKATRFIKDNFYKDDLSIEELVRVAGMSRADFYKQFKKVVGQTPNKFLTVERIYHSRLLLKSSDKPIKQIAYEVGFVTSHHFISRFKKITGLTPGVFRNSFQV